MTVPALEAALNVTAEQLAALPPPQVDAFLTPLAECVPVLLGKRFRVLQAMHRALGEHPLRSGQLWPTTDAEAEAEVREWAGAVDGAARTLLIRHLEALGTVRLQSEAVEVSFALIDAEWERRGRWSRFIIAAHHRGRVHRDRECRYIRELTRTRHLPDLAGGGAQDAVRAHGPVLCTSRFAGEPPEHTCGLPRRKPDAAARPGRPRKSSLPAGAAQARRACPCGAGSYGAHARKIRVGAAGLHLYTGPYASPPAVCLATAIRGGRPLLCSRSAEHVLSEDPARVLHHDVAARQQWGDDYYAA